MTCPRRRALATAALLLLCAVFTALGCWQVERRAWKHALIARVDARVHAAPMPAPEKARWPEVNAADDEYRHVRLQGRWLAGRDTRVQAVTSQGAGYWLLAPLRLDDGSVVLVNRGFVPPGWKSAMAAAPDDPLTAPATVTGLLRLSEPGGGFLRHNDPAGGHWYSRDVQAIAAAQGLAAVAAPYFVDADAAAPTAAEQPGAAPVAGLTVVAFRDSHLVYALTWYGLALLAAWGARIVWREGRRRDPAGGGENTRSEHARSTPLPRG